MVVVNTNQQTEKNGTLNAITKKSLAAPRHVLVVEDHDQTRDQLKRLIEKNGDLIVHTAANGQNGLEEIENNNFSIVLTDLRMPKMDGLELIKEIEQRRLPVSVIVMTAFGTVDDAVKAMRLGADDFLTKPIDSQHLSLVLGRALRERELQDEVAALREQLQYRFSFHNVLSKNAAMHQLFETVTNLGHTNTTVLIEGETGTGKEQLAKAIHQTSERRSRPWVAVNCAALPESLLESELFGHEKGAFTNAAGQRKGRFELAEGGTIFLDEVGDIPATMQAKLLRVLQERCFERVGGTDTLKVDVRVIAATNRDLQELVEEGDFREDLYYRLNVVKLKLPPLRERREDIPLLAAHFAEKYSRDRHCPNRITPRAMEALLDHHWPGNIRELENAIERACVTSTDNIICRDRLPVELLRPEKQAPVREINFELPLKEVIEKITEEAEESYLREALRRTHGDVGKCAKFCGMSRRSISAKIAKYGIKRRRYKELV